MRSSLARFAFSWRFQTVLRTVEEAAFAIGAKYETLGYLVYRGIMPLEMVEELVGGVGVSTDAGCRSAVRNAM